MEGYLLLVLTTLVVHVHTASVGTVSSPPFKQDRLATKTPYFWRRDRNVQIPQSSGINVNYKNNDYKAIYLDGTFRYGAKYPKKKQLKKFVALQKLLSDNPHYTFIKDWKCPALELRSHLSEVGENEMRKIGSFAGNFFYSLLKENFGKFQIYSSNKRRTKDSAERFSQGVIDGLGLPPDTPKPAVILNNTMLRFYKYCDKYKTKVKENDTARAEIINFENGQEMKTVINNVNNKLLNGTSLNFDQVETIYRICALELGLYSRSDWCQLLSVDDMKVFEYYFDLDYYWEASYGYEINYKISCPLFEAIFKSMDEAILKKNEKPAPAQYVAGTARFGHANTISRMLAALGLYKDLTALKANNYATQTGRLWKTGKLLPFSAGVSFTLYKALNATVPDPYIVRTTLNGATVSLPPCKKDPFCPLTKVRAFFGAYVDNCNFQQMCAAEPVV